MNQNYNFVRGLFLRASNSKKEEFTSPRGVFFSFLLVFVFAIFAGTTLQGQTTIISPTGDGGFENGATFASNGWTAANSVNNPWIVGSAISTSPFVGNSAYISNNALANSYTTANNSSNFFYRDVTVPAGQTKIILSFNWSCQGEATWDNWQVFYAPTTVTPVGSVTYPGSGNTNVPAVITGATFVGFGQTTTGIQTATLLLPASLSGTTFRIIFSWKNDGGGTQPPAGIDNISLVSSLPQNAVATAIGGLWSSPATWVGGVVPISDNVTIPSGSTVTVDQVVSQVSLTIDGTLQWNGSSNAMTIGGNVKINSGGKFFPYTTGGTGQTINITGNLENDGYTNLAAISTSINFNGSGSTLSGSGIFEGDGTRGIIRALTFSNLGSNSITTTQNLTITSSLAVTAGSLNTNGKLKIDNTAQIYGQALNLQVANIAVTNLGSLYTVAPVVFGTAVVPYANALSAVLGTRYFSGNNVYLCTTAGTFNATAPTTTGTTTFTTSGPTLIWIGTLGTLGTNVPYSGTLSLTAQYFYGDNVYQAIATTATTTMPVHTSGTVGGFRYLGTVAKATVNFDSVTGTVRSLNLTQTGSGFSTVPFVILSKGTGDTTGTGATASAVLFQQIAGPTNSITSKSGGAATITGGLTINSDQGASIASTDVKASSGVGNISTTNGGLNYTVAPLVGFAGPPTLNLVTNAGSAYTAAPTVTVTGGTLVSGTALATANFTITMNQGKVVSVYLNTGTSATYSSPPTLAFSTGNATLAFPAGCWPAATANIGSNGQLISFTMTNAGYGYAAAPIVGVGTVTATSTGGTFTAVASAPTARIALYNLTLNLFVPTAVAVVGTDDAAIPTNRKMNNLSLAGNGNGLNLANNLTLFGTSPLTLTSSTSVPGNILDLGGNNLLFTWIGYSGTSATFGATNTFIKNGSMTVNSRGGGTLGSTFNFPFSGTVTTFTGGNGSIAVTGGTDITTVKVSDVAAPTNSVIGGTGIALGSRAFKIDTETTFGTVPTSATLTGGTPPTVKLNYNSTDTLSATQDQTFVVEASSLNGAWNVRSAAVGVSGALAATGTATTITAAPGPIVFASGNFYAWGTSSPTIAGVSPSLVCANSGAFTITGTNLSGVTEVKIGGTPVLNFTVVSPTSITGFAGNGTSGFLSVTKNGVTVTGIENITVSPSPIAPAVSVASVSVNLGGTITVTASGGSGTFNWYNAANGGAILFTGTTFNGPVCSGNLWVAENNGSCDGLRTMVTITTAPTTISSSVASFCGVGSPVTLTAAPTDATITYTWSSLTAPATTAPATGATSVTSSLNQTSDFRVTATKGACTAEANVSIGVYALPSATVTSTAQGVCPGTSATIGSGLVAGNFAVTSVPYLEYLAPANAVFIATGGVANVPLSGGSLDDGGWSGIPIGFNFNFFGTSFNSISAGTNGLLMFGTPPGYGTANGQLGQYTFNTTPAVFPNAANPGNVIALMAADQNFGSGTSSSLIYWTQGYAPNRIFVIEYNKVNPYGSSTTNFTAQARLYETLGTVDIAIVGRSATNSATVGLQDATKTIGAVAPGRQAFSTTITTPETWRFAPPANYNTTWFADGVAMPSVTANPTATPPVVGYANPGTNVFSIPVAPSATTTYSISYTNQTTGCTNAAGSAQVVMAVLGNTIPAGLTTTASSTTICTGQSVNFNTSFTGITDGIVFQWQNSIDGGTTWTDITSANATTYSTTPTITSQYRCKLVACNGVPGYSSAVAIGFSNAIVTTTPGLRCGTGTATLGATGSAGATVNWYANATGGASLGVGPSFTTPSISANTTFYAGAETFSTGVLPLGLGALVSSNSGQSFLPGFWGGSKTQYIIKASELIAAGIGAGNITSLGFEPTTSDQTYQGFSVSMAATTNSVMTTAFQTAGLSQVYLGTLADNGYAPISNTVNNLVFGTGTGSVATFNWNGSSNILVSISRSSVPAAGTSVETAMKVDNVGFVSTAYDLADNLTPADMLASATADATTSFRPRFIINGQVICSSPRAAVVATVTAPPAIALSGNPATICSEQSTAAVTVVTGRSDYDTYVWTPSATVTGNATSGWVFNPLSTTAYTLVVSQSTGTTPCVTSTGITVSVNPTPSVITISPTPATVCIDTVLPLVATGGTISPNYVNTMDVLPSDFTLSTTNSATVTPNSTYFAQGTGSVLFNVSSVSSTASYALNTDLDMTGSPAATLTFSHIAAMESPFFSYDFGYVEYSVDGGSNWINFSPADYVGTADATVFNTTARFSGKSYADWIAQFTSTTSDPGVGPATSLWKSETFNIPTSALTSTQFKIRFRYTTDGSTNYYGWLIDNVKVNKSAQTNIVWSPTTNLYSDAAATTPYTGGNASTVYVKSNVPVSTINYTATAASALGCVRTAIVPVTIYQTLAPTGLQFYQFCPTSNTTVNDMSASLVGTGIKWYTVPFGGTALASTTALTQGYFWATQTANGCESQSRFAVFAISNATPAPSSNPLQQFCLAATVSNLTANGSDLKWYVASSGGIALASTASIASGTYYVSQTSGGCESPRTAVAVIVTVVPNPNATEQSLCSNTTVASLTATGTGLNWYAASTGGSALASSTVLVTGTYYVSQTINTCEGARTAVSVTINTTPAPTGEATQSLSSLLTVSSIVAVGTNVVWYSSSANAASGTNPLPSASLLANTTYYGTQTIAGCASTSSLAVTITTLSSQDFDMTKFSYYPNPVINLLNVSYYQDMTNVKVFNMIGQQLLNKDVNASSTQIDLSSFADGAYMIQVSTENAIKTVRVIKK